MTENQKADLDLDHENNIFRGDLDDTEMSKDVTMAVDRISEILRDAIRDG